MDHLRILAETQGFFTRAQLLELGYDDRAIQRAIRARSWVRVRRGAYTFTDLWSGTDEVEQHLARARAVLRRLEGRVALSHVSAALHLGLDVWDVDLSRVHVTRLDGGAGRTEAGVVHHEGLCLDSDVTKMDGDLVMRPARAALETGLLSTAESAVVVLDSGLRRGLFTPEELDATHTYLRQWPGTLGLELAVRFADGRAESVGESRARYLCFARGLPKPELQYAVHDARGALVGITDMAWPGHGLLGEFDGKVKYGRLLRPGESPGDAVFREKRREDALREATGFAVVRIVWADLYDGHRTAQRILRLMRARVA
jgi:hypothetical protein